MNGSLITPKHQLGLAIEYFIFSSLSIISITIVFVLTNKFKIFQSLQYKLIEKILIFDYIYAIITWLICFAYFFVYGSDDQISNHQTLCQIEGLSVNYSIIAAVLWTSIVCHNLYSTTMNEEVQVYRHLYTIIGFGLPAIFSIIPFFLDGYGPYNPMPQTNCFFNMNLNEKDFEMYKFCFFYIPVWGSFIYNIIVISIVIKKISSMVQFSSKRSRLLLYQLFLYPGIILFCWIIPDILLQFNLPSAYVIQGLGPLIGMMDSLGYGMQNIKKQIQFNGCGWSLKEQIDV